MHSKKICHRDIKVENIILNKEDDAIKLIDFGLSCKTDKCEKNKALGTLMFMAPEVLRHEKYTEKSDMWSIGVVLFVMLTGRVPFVEQDKSKLYEEILTGQFDVSGKKLNSLLVTFYICLAMYKVNISDFAKDLIKKLMH